MTALRGRLGVLILAGASACQFDATLPDTAVLRCVGGTCPSGFTCRPKVGLCVSDRAASDGEAPRVLSGTLSPTRLRDGQELRAEFVVSEPLLNPPVVRLFSGTRARELALLEQDGERYVLRTTIDAGVDTEGLARVTASLLDRSGTENGDVSVGVVELDFTPPALASTGFVGSRGTVDGGLLELIPSDGFGVRVTLSEAVQPTGALRATGSCDGGPTLVLREASGSRLDFELQGALVDGCRSGFTLDGCLDVAGNLAPPLPLPLAIAVDGTPPGLSQLEVLAPTDGGLVPRRRFSRVAGFDVLVLRFAADSAVARYSARFDEEELAGCACAQGRCQCERRVAAADAEGGHLVSVTGWDSAGNTRVLSGSVELDFSAPAPVPGSPQLLLTPPAGCPLSAVSGARAGTGVRVEFEATEACTAALDAGAGPPLLLARSTSSSFVFEGVTSASVPDGLYALSARLVDEVGNAAVAPLGLAVRCAQQPPAAPDTESPSAVVLQRAPWGARDAGPSLSVVGADGAAPAGLLVRLWGSEGPLGSTRASDAGAFSVSAASVVDRTVVSLETVDDVCNRSPLREVKNVEWYATLNGKVPGRAFENPHELARREVFGWTASQPDEAEVSLDAPVVQRGAVGWRRVDGVPCTRYSTPLVQDTHRGRFAFFGGSVDLNCTGANADRELWEWEPDGGTWTNLTPSVPTTGLWPPSRALHAMAYDSLRRKYVLYGGVETRQGSAYLDDLWEWDPTSARWTHVERPPGAGAWPTSSAYPTLGFDQAHGTLTLVLVDGTSVALWSLDGRTHAWRRLDQGLAAPPGRIFGGVEVAPNGHVFLFGGRHLTSPFVPYDDLWEWDGTRWLERSATRPTPWPGGRELPTLSYDAARGRLLMFGGGTAAGGVNELWEYDVTAGTWTLTTPSTAAPAGRYYHVATYDPLGQRLFVFNGLQGFNGQLWQYAIATRAWTNRTAAATPWPKARTGAASWKDASRSRVGMFGGYDPFGTAAVTYDELWSLDLATWRWVNQTVTPRPTAWPPTASSGVYLGAYDAQRDRAVLYGTTSAAPYLRLWELNPATATWTDRARPDAGLPSPAFYGPTWTYDSTRGVLLRYGGEDISQWPPTTYERGELWSWAGDAGSWSMASVAPPSAREGVTAYDETRRKLLLYGYAPDGGTEIWEYDAQTNAWTLRRAGGAAEPEAFPGELAYDRVQDRFLAFGGITRDRRWSSGLWSLDPTSLAWTDLSPTSDSVPWPAGRYAHWLQLSAANEPVVFGGVGQGPVGQVTLNDLWVYGADTQPPGVVARFAFAAAGAEPGAQVRRVRVRVEAGGGGAASQPVGVRLFASVGDALLPERTAAFPSSQPGAVEWEATDAGRLGDLFEGPARVVAVGVAPQALSVSGMPSSVRLTWVDLLVSYRRP